MMASVNGQPIFWSQDGSPFMYFQATCGKCAMCPQDGLELAKAGHNVAIAIRESSESDWLECRGDSAWHNVFGIQMQRLVITSGFHDDALNTAYAEHTDLRIGGHRTYWSSQSHFMYF
eukprot:gnl/TRDRNA2_/TRDRNA2_36927_c1_seq1.p1 gnl/TRDRNA2_/TRDRNA2_36927_c1~~gnl/TRDRNA2_/TRDRNA2_36927_c1_seq1.p1  ORF type:complete len:118 (+),score=11.83 gnl/TRDRNA2_/TRDRNA2_36927_c1_seq1:27-380(+)